MKYRGARLLNMGLATWLALSAYAWRHDAAQFAITVGVGIIVLLSAPFAVGAPMVRFVNTAAGLCLIAAAFLLPRISVATAWHNAVVGLGITILSLIGPRPHAVYAAKVSELRSGRSAL